MPLKDIIRERARQSFAGIRNNKAGSVVRANLTTKDTKTMMKILLKSVQECNIEVSNSSAHVATKKGRNVPKTADSNFWTMADPKGGPCGTARPRIKGPMKIVCLHQSARTADPKTRMMIKYM